MAISSAGAQGDADGFRTVVCVALVALKRGGNPHGGGVGRSPVIQVAGGAVVHNGRAHEFGEQRGQNALERSIGPADGVRWRELEAEVAGRGHGGGHERRAHRSIRDRARGAVVCDHRAIPSVGDWAPGTCNPRQWSGFRSKSPSHLRSRSGRN